MAAPSPRSLRMSSVKAKLLSPSLSSQYQVWFNPPQTVRNWLKIRGVDYDADPEFYSLSCSEASLPGSTLTTFEINNDFTGVTQRHAYRRLYDDRADFTCYVDSSHRIIRFFENWMNYIVDEQITTSVRGGVSSPLYHYRVQFPKDYKTEIYINKFERDFAGNVLTYRFLEAFPVSINSMPVSYDSSNLVKLTVSFVYTRYVIDPISSQAPSAFTNNPIFNNPQFGVDTEGEFGQTGFNITRTPLNTNPATGGNLLGV
jgi:hypothetical protein